jgi:hypothetical protein
MTVLICLAILAYVATFVLIRYRLNDEKSESTTTTADASIATVYAKYAPSGSTTPVDKPRTPSALESGNSRSREKAAHVHPSHAFASSPATPFLFGWPPFFSTLTHALTSILDEPPLLNIDVRRVSLFNFGTILPCVAGPVDDGDPKADAEKNAKALVRLLNRCHGACSTFALAGFLLVLTGIVSYVWTVLERPVAIFGSTCVGFCIVVGLAALR